MKPLTPCPYLERLCWPRLTCPTCLERCKVTDRDVWALVWEHRGLATCAAGYFAPTITVSREDLVAVALEGLFIGVSRFDPDRGNALSTYAFHWMRHKLVRELSAHGGTVRIAPDVTITRRALSRLDVGLGRKAEDGEAAEALGMHATAIAAARSAPVNLDRLDAPRFDGLTPLHDAVADLGADDPERHAELADIGRIVNEAVDSLSPKESAVVAARYGLGGMMPETLASVGGRIGVTRERVRQLEVRALGKLRRRLEPAVARGDL